MSYQNETKNCQNCKKDFTIESDDFSFYEKIKVPPPTFCPECRLQKRLAWMIDIKLFKRKCDLCKEEGICKYETNAPYLVYCHKCWWSDKWDSNNFTKEVNFSKSFLEQFNELLHKTPILGLSIDTITGKLSPYVNHCDKAKNCYMIFYSSRNEDCMFGFYLVDSKSVLNCSNCFNSELCFDNFHSFKNFKVFGSSGNVTTSIDSYFLKDCDNCQNCFGSVNLQNKKYVYFNEQLSKEDYFQKISEIDLGSYKTYQDFKLKTNEHYKKFPSRGVYQERVVNSTGNYIFEVKNCRECFDVYQAEDSKYLMLIKGGPVKDCYDFTDYGFNSERIYDSIVVGENVSNIKFCWYVILNSSNIEYSALCVGCKDCFGCVGLKKKQYCILNKQYTKEEYEVLIEKIKKHMNENPYIDKKGRVYKYGEFFPMEFSTYPYNNSFANLFYSKTNKEIIETGLRVYEPKIKQYPITINYKDLPDNIRDIKDDILKEVIACSICNKGFKIIKEELNLSRKLNVPLSRECPFCRIENNVNKWISQMKQINRVCDKCGTDFKTHLTKEDSRMVYCKKCYQQEVY